MSSALSIYFGLPEARLFRFPPGPHPPLIKPAQAEISWERPINISSTVYTFSLDARVPITTACLYLIFVCTLNYLNKKRQYRPWPITRTASFTRIAFVHNILLSIFSAWFFLGVCRTVTSSLPPLPRAPHHIADVFCRFDRSQGSGPPPESTAGGNAIPPPATFHDGFTGMYEAESLWEKGMNYYTWLFYISKYYEIIDTLLLLVKGKRVSFLQMYHHAGVIICSWVGVIYRTPQAVVGIFLNAGIHTLMYLYYSLTILRIKVPVFIKRTLTRLQITQFVLGGLASWLYVFVSYDSPIGVSLVETRDSDNQTHVRGEGGSTAAPCMDNSGQVFALLLATLYLIPLTQLFLQFFGRTYKLTAKNKSL
ncbi:hypothetical protein ABOM_008369 [Aspergillus bombycis]|uniref:Elongation of fatty acids protein n=1 Tax=Aspergillus bombycis TaxID=109264 RepID=A0A1F7ZSH3_9EURO|nr:hypothetical protein ABOM_008369 [Aspergillus bombycis]OGM42406.1 hypothetical protein ABOM_008369 [Aspergillus bombycis]